MGATLLSVVHGTIHICIVATFVIEVL